MFFLAALASAKSIVEMDPTVCAGLHPVKVVVVGIGPDYDTVPLPDVYCAGPDKYTGGAILCLEQSDDDTEYRMKIAPADRPVAMSGWHEGIVVSGYFCPRFVDNGSAVIAAATDGDKTAVLFFDGTAWHSGPEVDLLVRDSIRMVGGYPMYEAIVDGARVVVWKDSVTPSALR
jgi:hypothetical protein